MSKYCVKIAMMATMNRNLSFSPVSDLFYHFLISYGTENENEIWSHNEDIGTALSSNGGELELKLWQCR